MRQALYFLIASLMLAIAPTAPAADSEVIVAATSVRGRTLKVTFAQGPIATDSRDAVVCSEPRSALMEAKLWMPSMGHGSTPTRIVPLADGCTKVERLNFVMGGAWELQIKFADADKGVFAFDVAE